MKAKHDKRLGWTMDKGITEGITEMNDMRSKSNVHAYVYALKKRGYVDIIRHSKRSIVVL